MDQIDEVAPASIPVVIGVEVALATKDAHDHMIVTTDEMTMDEEDIATETMVTTDDRIPLTAIEADSDHTAASLVPVANGEEINFLFFLCDLTV